MKEFFKRLGWLLAVVYLGWFQYMMWFSMFPSIPSDFWRGVAAITIVGIDIILTFFIVVILYCTVFKIEELRRHNDTK